MSPLRLLILLPLLSCIVQHSSAQEPKVIHAYAVGNWRNGPVVYITPLFATTEAFTTPMLLARVRQDYPEFKDITDIEVQRFATAEEGELSRRELKAKYRVRQLEVRMVEAPPTRP